MVFSRRTFFSGLAKAVFTASAYLYAPKLLELDPTEKRVIEVTEMWIGKWMGHGGAFVRFQNETLFMRKDSIWQKVGETGPDQLDYLWPKKWNEERVEERKAWS